MSQQLKITGMSCQHCERRVREALVAVAGVESVSIDLAAGRARVEGAVESATLIAAVEAAGYQAEPC
ncbi:MULTISPECIES: heavy-metal-associated domain-containing protein [Marichromatium]|uniref:Copper chaperone CopZ n=1 Tax=Marichromatium gracile TaxID=1048 RepID=A0A4R4ADD7_MARGR|nr:MULTISPECIES: heavy metal-associated domain-containing protein [Marichromatium]MBK1709206.1 heavy metal transport/detoxification protein [Marichromatium gracile]RNE91432.1 heavy-metal-associated domain-containing protein [Marichromatium sp. AB31]TCW37102.1 copper chaperone CopZ [Marichromatium gracile]